MTQRRYKKIIRSSHHGLENFLGELELEVMEVVWERDVATVAEVREALKKTGKTLAYTTVMTVMTRLVEKDWLVAEKMGRAFSYHARRSRQEAEAQAVGSIFRNLIKDFGGIAVAQFVRELDDVAPEQIADLAKLIQSLETDAE